MGKRDRARRIELPTNVIEIRPSMPVELHRSFDAADINPILNHPSVFPFISIPGLEKIDATDLLANPSNVLLMANGGGIMFCQSEPGIYEVHTNFLPEYRGRNAIKVSQDAYKWMFDHTDCMVLQTRVPAFNKAADLFCKIVGATKEFERKAVWPTKNGDVDMSFWSLRYEDWVRKADGMQEAGHAFHQKLESERIRHGVDEPLHADEDCHDRYVGACVKMIYAGQPEKAIVLYNRFARFSGYGQISLIAKSPLVVDIGDALLQVGDRDFKVIKFKAVS